MRLVPNLREDDPEIDPFDLDEVVRFLDQARDWERSFLCVQCFAGLRPNETLALEWDDLDFARMKLRVRRTASRYDGAHATKTKRSNREVDMLDIVRDELQAQRARSQLRGKLVFPNLSGSYVDLGNFTNRRWKKILQDAKVRHRNMYQCRHTYATLRLSASQPDSVQYVADQLGHTTIGMVIKHYSRWMRTPVSMGASALNKSIAAAKGSAPAEKKEVS